MASEKRDTYNISIEDASALILAHKKNAILLSGDNKLRKTAEGEGVIVFGVLWIFDRLLEKKVLNPTDAISKLKALLKIGSFLPNEICERRIHEWGRLSQNGEI